MGFFILGLVLYDIMLYKGIIYLHEAIALFLIVILYVFVIFRMEKVNEKNMKMLKGVPRASHHDEEIKILNSSASLKNEE